MFRLAVFLSVIAGTWGAGVYYLLAHENSQLHPIFGFAAAVMGGVLSVVMTWLAVELATDLNDSDAKRVLPTSRVKLRLFVHKILALPEWA
jgi:branched-subunit amino acid ABC-type transport system permease component